MDITQTPETSVTPTHLESNPSSSRNLSPPNAPTTLQAEQSSTVTSDEVIDYDEVEEETRQFMAELPSGPFTRDLTLSPPPETPSSAPPTVDPATLARQQQEQEQEVQRVLSQAQATSTLPGQQVSAPSSSLSDLNPLANLSIPRTSPTMERERSQALLSATDRPVSMQVDEEMVEMEYTPVSTSPNCSRPAPPPPPPTLQASQAMPGVEELSFTRYPRRGKTRSSQYRQSTQASTAGDFLQATLAATLMRLQRSQNGAQILADAMNGTAIAPRSRGSRGGQRRQQNKGAEAKRD
ncbi:kinesin K39 [Rhodotorula toruloides]|uniref:Kinesin K39 n=1 Tax=Rhodotorula toruloides TaxID=5286 RepID=A0A511KAR7_RHOTO|nr:kinesin K39 [Rhodotorula toruloides]